jgi:outer membrane protein assembly factor BamB
MGDAVYGTSNNGHGFAVDRQNGTMLWDVQYATDTGGDVGYPGAHDGVFVMGMETGTVPGHEGGNWRILGVDGHSGQKLWDYRVEWPSWNFMPIFPGDDTVVFMDFTGGAYRLGLHNGTEIWHSKAPGTLPEEPSFGDGGLTVSNGMAFTCSGNGTDGGSEGTHGALRAYRLTDGALLWDHVLPQPCNTWPSVGRLGSGPELSVVVTPGSFMGSSVLHGGMMAFDATSGRLQWKWQAEPYSHVLPFMEWMGTQAMGDLEGMHQRSFLDPNHPICLPAHWSAPMIMGDGSVLAGRSDGVLYKLRGPSDKRLLELSVDTASLPTAFKTSPGVILEDSFNAEGASLHGAFAVAPGILAYSTCTDRLFVFKY